MASSSDHMNMSGSAGRSFEHNHSHTTGNDSDSSFSADFKDIKMQTRKVGDERLTEADFGGRKGVWSRVVIGEIFAEDGGDHELTWENETTEVQLTWSVNCNLEGQEGIASDSGAGWAGWDDTEKCYLGYDADIGENEHCMRIVEIEVVSKPKVNKADRKAARKSRKATKGKSKAKAKGSDSDILDDEDVEVPSTCVHKSTKGKSKGKACGKAMESMTEDGVALCKKHANAHANAHAKKTEKAAAKSAIESGLSGSGSASKAEEEKSRPVQAVTKQATLESGSEDDEESKSDTCVYEFTKGKSLGETCDKSTVIGSDMCAKHKKAADKKAGKEEIEISGQKEDKSSDMAASTQTKNMSTALMEALTEIITGALKGKYAEKALAALQTDEAQVQLTEVIKTNTPTKVIRAAGNAGGRRRKKDPAAPKRGCSSYIFFCNDKRAEVKDANPDMKGTEVTKELGRIWREETSDKQKKKYSKQATADKERYLEEMKNYTPSAEWLTEAEASDSEGGKTKRKKSKRKPGPKRARSAYIFFCTEMRSKVKEDNDDMDAKEVTAELGRLWREEYKDDKDLSKKFNKMAKKDKERFEQEKAEWVDPEPADDESFAPEPTKSSKKAATESADEEDEKKEAEPVKKSSKKKSKKGSKKKAKAVPSGYTVFCQQTRQAMREENADWSMSKVTKEMKRIWESMDDDEKAAYSQ
jgi:hypothetical protein